MNQLEMDQEALLLNVNDDAANRYSVTRVLRHAGYRIIEAESGEAALHAVSAHRPSLVILDVKLPDMSGFDVCRRIKQDYACAVLHLSALAVDARDRVTGLEGGADGYLTQPAEPQVLLATVRSLLRMQKAESDARASAEHWQACFDAIRDGVALVGKGGRILRCNSAFDAIFGRPMAGNRAFGQDGALCDVEGDEGERTELSMHGRWFQISVDPFEVMNDQRGCVLVMVDVTERKLLEQALTQRAQDLAEADLRKDEFLAMLAHELRNPLTAVTSALHLLPDGESTQRVSEVIKRQTLHVARLVDDLVDVSRIRRGRVELRRSPVDLSSIARSVVDAVRPRMTSLGHTLSLEADGALPVVGDPTRLEQVISNLLDNAARYSQDPGKISVRVFKERDAAVVEVKDQGEGISPAMLEKVFDLFTQLNVKIDRSRGGLGIGLTLVRNIVEMHGGQVRAESAGEGKGATFRVWLPLAKVEARPIEHQQPEPPAAQAAPKRILIIEDNDDAREMLKDLLEAFGHKVSVECDGKSGLDRARSEKFDVAIVDIGLPIMDGYTVARSLHEDPGVDRAPYLVALTGYGSHEEKSRSASAGFDVHMVKPVDVDQLLRVLASLDREHSAANAAESLAQQRA